MSKKKPIDPTSNDRFYSGKKPTVQMGLYKLFCVKYKIKKEVLIEYLDAYRLSKQTPAESFGRTKTLELVSFYFDDFIKFVSEKSGIKFGDKMLPKKRRDTYQEWYEQSAMDGSFAYNGSADDF